MDYPKFRATEIITSFLLEDCAQVALQYFWFEERFHIFKTQIHRNFKKETYGELDIRNFVSKGM